MRDVTRDFLIRVADYPWFSRATNQLVDDSAVSVGTWEAAARLAMGEVWSSVQLQVKNRIGREINRRSYSRYTEWNRIAAEVRGAVQEILDRRVLPIMTTLEVPESITPSVRWDIGAACMEVEYSDVMTPLFFAKRLDPWYREGRFPCGWQGSLITEGWEGELPEFKLYVL